MNWPTPATPAGCSCLRKLNSIVAPIIYAGYGSEEVPSFWKNKKVLVAGGCGFVGSYLVEMLLAEEARVTVIDNLSRGLIENISHVLGSVRFLNLDMRNIDNCREASAGQDVVMNLASPAFGIEYSQSHHGEMLTDVTLTGFNALRGAWLEGVKRFLVVSSSCVYPDDAVIPTPESESCGGRPLEFKYVDGTKEGRKINPVEDPQYRSQVIKEFF